jgi:DNA-binding CsgD family transcriptional regulator
MLDTSDAFAIEGTILRLDDPICHAMIRDFLASESNARTVVRIISDDPENDLIMRCEKIALSPMATGITVIETKADPSLSYFGFETAWNLSRREAAICKLLLSGKTVEKIVKHLEKSNDTVRFHIRNIYRKMGVSSREEFFAKMQPFRF